MIKVSEGQFIFSPSDLTTYLKSPFASWMERASKENSELRSLKDEPDALMKSLQSKGYEHEEAFFQSLIEEGNKTYINIEEKVGMSDADAAVSATTEAMQEGIDIIFQGCLQKDNFRGFSDFLIKVPGQSNLGDYHYEVWDTKLSKSVQAYFIVQLCCYAEMLEAIQGIKPESVKVVLGNNQQVSFRTEDYYFSYLAIKQKFVELQESFNLEAPLDPAEYTSYADWSDYAKHQLLAKDHLSQVANITQSQIAKLNVAGITTMQELATTNETAIKNLPTETFEKLKDQAFMQVKSQGKEIPEFKVLPHQNAPAKGLSLLPAPSSSDIFFDIEGDPLYENGLEYLWGVTYLDDSGQRQFKDFWAHDHEQEKLAFKSFIEWAYQRWQADPGMHIYHYAHYEIAACRRLMGRYGVCEHEVDQLLRNEVFVDLYAVVRHGLRIGEPRYSIKNVEHIYRGKRDTDVASGGESVEVYEAWRANPDGLTWQTSEVLKSIRDYNQDDCDSTLELYEWLYGLQQQESIEFTGKLADGQEDRVARPKSYDEVRTQLYQKCLAMAEAVKADYPEESKLYRLLAEVQFFHDREDKPMWWKLFDRLGMDYDELYDDIECISGAIRTSKPIKDASGPRAKKYQMEYQLDTNQEFKVPRSFGQKATYKVLENEELPPVQMISFDVNTGIFVIQAKEPLDHDLSLVPLNNIRKDSIIWAVLNVVEQCLHNFEQPSAILDFLRRQSPRTLNNVQPYVDAVSSAERLTQTIDICNNLDNSLLTIQGPPGAGKTYTAKFMILDLLRQGKRVGVTSNSHKAIVNLLKAVSKQAEELGESYSIYHCSSSDVEVLADLDMEYIKNQEVVGIEGALIGSTAWGFCHENAANTFDYLFVDEAGQVAIANLIGMGQATSNIVLLGDQMQLGQPIQGSHPDEVGKSSLEYFLQHHQTIPKELGIFLGTTYRMHPDVNRFISKAFYEGRLQSAPQCANQKIEFNKPSHPEINKSTGLLHIEVPHIGCTQASEEEAERILELKEFLVGQTFVDNGGMAREMTLDDILFIAPYNHQVNVLKYKLGFDARVGSVDLFQGQEAPVVILSMCSSRADESARGMEFLLDPNRFNVAISRAQALAIVVSSDKLMDVDFNSEHALRLANNFELLKRLS